MKSAEDLQSGNWTSRWHGHVVELNASTAQSGWTARVWSWPEGTPHTRRVQLATKEPFESALDAAMWACTVLEKHGASAIVGGKKRNLVAFLAFEPITT